MAPKPMSANDVSRLLGRTSFGASAADLDLWTGKPYADLVELIVTTSTQPAPVPLPDEVVRQSLEANKDSTWTQLPAAREWWLERMRTTPFPLLERMTLFWHGHFATAVSIPPFVHNLIHQNETMRTHALGNFRDLTAAMTVDVAMLYWLNGYQNTIPHPNENYAREFFELFTLGKVPQVYTETDIRQAARAFTGWYLNSQSSAVFSASRHDKGVKRVLGHTVKNLGDQEYLKLVDIALAHPASYGFIAWKLVANFCYVPTTTNTIRRPDALIRKVAAALKTSKWDIAAGVRAMLLADEFRYAKPGQGRQYVRQPVECVVHAAKALNVDAGDVGLMRSLEGMGQSLFNPVNVGGWPLGADWISPVTSIARYDAGIIAHRLATSVTGAALPAADDVAGWAKRLGLGALSPNTKNAIDGYLRRTKTAQAGDRQAGVLTLLLSSPEWVVM